jgi:hypothetical protein
MVILGMAGLLRAVLSSLTTTMLHTVVPDAFRGRVMAILGRSHWEGPAIWVALGDRAADTAILSGRCSSLCSADRDGVLRAYFFADLTPSAETEEERR